MRKFSITVRNIWIESNTFDIEAETEEEAIAEAKGLDTETTLDVEGLFHEGEEIEVQEVKDA